MSTKATLVTIVSEDTTYTIGIPASIVTATTYTAIASTMVVVAAASAKGLVMMGHIDRGFRCRYSSSNWCLSVKSDLMT